MRIEILDETGRFRRRERLARVLRRVAEVVPLPRVGGGEPAEMTVVLVDDAAIAERNRADRGVDGPTDVLAYPLHEPDDDGFPRVAHLGDVVISLDTARRQARARRRPAWHEVAVLASHGLLHLIGFDHRSAAEWAPFETVQALAEAEAAAVDRSSSAYRSLRSAP